MTKSFVHPVGKIPNLATFSKNYFKSVRSLIFQLDTYLGHLIWY